MCHPAFVLRLSRLEQSAPFGQFWGIGDCVTCYGFGGGLCYVLRLWAVSVLRVTAFGGSCVTQCYVLQLFGSVTLDGVEARARQAAASDEEESPEARRFGYGYIGTGSRQRAKSGGVRWLSGRVRWRLGRPRSLT